VATALAVVLLLAGIGFVGVELAAPGFGAPGTAAAVCFVVGAMLLIDNRTSVVIPQPLFVGVGGAGIVLVAAVTVIALRVRRVPPHVPSRVIGEVGIALSDVDPQGTVRVFGEEWTATSSGPIQAGSPVLVVGEHGLKLRVEPFTGED
jgi:membrane-bound serine protease (ClpP class)